LFYLERKCPVVCVTADGVMLWLRPWNWLPIGSGKSGWLIGHAARVKRSLANQARPHNFNTVPKKKFHFHKFDIKLILLLTMALI
jgi:hypothetical protein